MSTKRVCLTDTQQAVLESLRAGGQLHATTRRAWLITGKGAIETAGYDNLARLRDLELIEIIGAQGAVTYWRISYRGRNLLARGRG